MVGEDLNNTVQDMYSNARDRCLWDVSHLHLLAVAGSIRAIWMILCRHFNTDAPEFIHHV